MRLRCLVFMMACGLACGGLQIAEGTHGGRAQAEEDQRSWESYTSRLLVSGRQRQKLQQEATGQGGMSYPHKKTSWLKARACISLPLLLAPHALGNHCILGLLLKKSYYDDGHLQDVKRQRTRFAGLWHDLLDFLHAAAFTFLGKKLHIRTSLVALFANKPLGVHSPGRHP